MSLRSKVRKTPQAKLRNSRLTRAQRRALRSARSGAARSAQILRDSGLSRAQMRAVQTAQMLRDSGMSAQMRAAQTAQRTAQRLGPTASQARRMASTSMEGARIWSAPRIDRAGRYVEHHLGPRVGMMLRRTAGRIEPARPRRSRRGIAATLLLAGGALGAAGAYATRRKKQAEEGAQEPTERLTSVSSESEERSRTS